MKSLLGGKGANLHEMTRIGLPVPAGFTITTEVCTHFYAHNRTYPPELEAEVAAALAKVEKSVGKTFGDKATAFARFRKIGCARFHAGNDGHHPEPGDE